MKAIMIMFDTLKKNYLAPYGCDWVHTPNFKRLAEKAVTFDKCFVGSLPCMPARRELHTGRLGFLHRGWGPIEPFDDSMPELLKESGVFTHLISDHFHYWEEGGANYHTRYMSWEIARGQEGDPWKCQVKEPEIPPHIVSRTDKHWRQDWVNRTYMKTKAEHSQGVTFNLAKEFLETNHSEDNWFLQVECFDPHEPFFSYPEYKKLYPHEYNGPHYDWPTYHALEDSEKEQIEHLRHEYAALLTMCDESLGEILDMMDKHDMWSDTMLIVNTDHGFFLGEHGHIGKGRNPVFTELSETPFFVWHPRYGVKGERRNALVQSIDIAPTLLDFFGVDIPGDMLGRPLGSVIEKNEPQREAALFGYFGGYVNCTDGNYLYMRAAANADNWPLYEYTLMPCDMKHTYKPESFEGVTLAEPFSFTKGVKTLKIPTHKSPYALKNGNMLFDLRTDPTCQTQIDDPETEHRMLSLMRKLMLDNDAPAEQYERLGIEC